MLVRGLCHMKDMKMNLNIYAIIVTYNGERYIEKCLNSLQESTLSVHTIVIDNLSTDNTTQIIEDKFPKVELIKSQKNLGFGKGNNIGLKKAFQANTDYVFLLNQDAYIEHDTIDKLINTHKGNTQYGILSPFHFDYSGKNIEFYFSSIINPFDCPHFINDMFFSNLNNIYEIKFVHAACWLISKDCLQTVGGFDPIFPHYSEDIDYVKRTKYYGFKIGIAPQATVYHVGTHSGLKELDKNYQLRFNFIILHLKDISHQFLGLFVTQQKMLFDQLTSAILYRRWFDIKMSFKLWSNSLLKIKSVLNSRKKCKERSAFIK